MIISREFWLRTISCMVFDSLQLTFNEIFPKNINRSNFGINQLNRKTNYTLSSRQRTNTERSHPKYAKICKICEIPKNYNSAIIAIRCFGSPVSSLFFILLHRIWRYSYFDEISVQNRIFDTISSTLGKFLPTQIVSMAKVDWHRFLSFLSAYKGSIPTSNDSVSFPFFI